MLNQLRYIFKHKLKIVDRILLFFSIFSSLIILFFLGYNKDVEIDRLFAGNIHILFYSIFLLNTISTYLAIWANKKLKTAHIGGVVVSLYFLLIAAARLGDIPILHFFRETEWLYFGILIITLVQVSVSSLFFDSFYFNPTILFVISILSLISFGAFLLMLPKSVVGTPLSFVDAVFMATSAVSITGLGVVDIATKFTFFGQVIVLILIQLGGLGIMTFTGFFGYFFSGGFSYKNQLMYGEIIGQNKIGSVIKTILKIISVTFLVEIIGAVILYFHLERNAFSSEGDRVFFAIFHAVSAFCNAGFTIAKDGLQHPEYKFNYPLHVTISLLFIVGGLGFSIVFNTYTYIKRWCINIFKKIFFRTPYSHKAWVISFNSRLMAWSSIILIVSSTLITFALEYNKTLAEHKGIANKLAASLFIGNGTRTSGFSIVETAELSMPMLVLMLFFMWVGASPGSTGGGVKNTTVGIALLNIISLAKGKDNLEIFHRKVSNDSTNKAFAIIMLSFVGMGISITLLAFTDAQHGLKAIIYEVFSAYSTCGLSLGITPELSNTGKIIISMTMFIGRVGLLTLLVAIIKNLKNKSYTYPEEKVLF